MICVTLRYNLAVINYGGSSEKNIYQEFSSNNNYTLRTFAHMTRNTIYTCAPCIRSDALVQHIQSSHDCIHTGSALPENISYSKLIFIHIRPTHRYRYKSNDSEKMILDAPVSRTNKESHTFAHTQSISSYTYYNTGCDVDRSNALIPYLSPWRNHSVNCGINNASVCAFDQLQVTKSNTQTIKCNKDSEIPRWMEGQADHQKECTYMELATEVHRSIS